MAPRRNVLQSFFSRGIPFAIAVTLMLAVTLLLAGPANAAGPRLSKLDGLVARNGVGLAGYRVALYASFGGKHTRFERIGLARTDADGHFQIAYFPFSAKANSQERVLFVIAEKGPAMLASAIGIGSGVGSAVPTNVVINERTTVATGNAFAQFVHGREIEGNTYGMKNAVHMAANLADPQTGAAGIVLASIPKGNPDRAINIPLGPPPAPNRPQMKPFGAAVDLDGNVWINNNRSDTVSVISPQGRLIASLPGTFQGKTVLSHPVGNAADSKGNIWVANSDWLDSPCPTRFMLGTATNPSITMFQRKDRRPHPGSPFTGGGLILPWGIAVDGDDTVWAFNFGVLPPPQTNGVPTGISRFCGINTRKCPNGMTIGDPISPDTGYTSDALERITGGQIDPSGNIWLTNNWKLAADPIKNPFGNAIVIAIGAAGPLKTPLIGPPVPFQ